MLDQTARSHDGQVQQQQRLQVVEGALARRNFAEPTVKPETRAGGELSERAAGAYYGKPATGGVSCQPWNSGSPAAASERVSRAEFVSHLTELEVAVHRGVPGALHPRRQRLHPAPHAWLAHLAGSALQVLNVLAKPQHRRLTQLTPQLLARALRLRRVAQGCVSRWWPAVLLSVK